MSAYIIRGTDYIRCSSDVYLWQAGEFYLGDFNIFFPLHFDFRSI